MKKCKYGDPLCPCQDGDMCHYEGPNPWPAPVQFRDGGWWFKDWGPYEDESAARQAQEHAEGAATHQ